jgi:hypothetical protein
MPLIPTLRLPAELEVFFGGLDFCNCEIQLSSLPSSNVFTKSLEMAFENEK